MRYVCKDTFDVEGLIIGKPGDIITIIDAVPNNGESYDDIDGYCDIFNETTGEIFGATWLDIDETVLEPVKGQS